MKIVRVLNTNAVVSADDLGRELIITGAGIGLKKKKGEHLDPSLVDKTYYLENPEDSRRLQAVVREISEEFLDIAARTIETARSKYNLQIRDTLYVTLTDHINSAVERSKAGVSLKNMMKLEIRKFYPMEYAAGLQAIQWIHGQTGISLGDDEAAFIAMHIVSSELESGEDADIEKITELITAILQIMRMHFKIDFDEGSLSYERFLTHLKFFASRVFSNTAYGDSMAEIYHLLVSQNNFAYSGVKKTADFIEKQYGYRLTIDEELYLLIHVKRILDEQ